MTNTRLNLTADMWEVLIYNTYRISDECAKIAPDSARWAEEIREILLEEASSPQQQQAERSEALSDATGDPHV
jgi:hypothetical protein